MPQLKRGADFALTLDIYRPIKQLVEDTVISKSLWGWVGDEGWEKKEEKK